VLFSRCVQKRTLQITCEDCGQHGEQGQRAVNGEKFLKTGLFGNASKAEREHEARQKKFNDLVAIKRR
jgi:hypothetical protein